MSEDNSIQKGCVEYVVSEEDFEPKDPSSPPLKPNTDFFRKVVLVHNNQTKEDGDEIIVDNEDYVRIQLSPKGYLFGTQVDIFVRTPFHSAIVQFEGYEFYPKHAAVTKYYPNGSLQHLLKEINAGNPNPEWNGTMKSICVFGLVSAVTHIHNIFDEENPNFSIRYLCPENIIFDINNQPKLIHYVFGKEDLGQKPNAYIPPEVHENPDASHYDEDIWDIGMIFYEILTGHKPYQGKSEDDIKTAVMNGELPEFPPSSPETDNIIGIIQNCLSKDPKKRPLPYILYDHLLNLSDDLFPDTNKVEYDNYREKIQQETVQSDESLSYFEMINEDDEDHAELFEKANANDPYSLIRVGRMYQKGSFGVEKDEAKAFDYYMKAANLSYATGLYNASIFLRDGRGCEKNLEKSFEMMKKAADLNLDIAVSTYGNMVKFGIGTVKDVNKAIEIFEEGAKKNNKECLNSLGMIYYEGYEGIEKDVGKGLSLLKKAAQNGSEEANNTLALYFYDQGKTSHDKKKIEKALNMLMKAADHNSATAYLNLAKIYAKGDQVPKDIKKVVQYYKAAAKLKNIDGIIMYAYHLDKGIGCKKDVPVAATYYHEAALKGDKRGQHNYARIIYNGEDGVPRDVLTASKFFKMAAEQGVPNSMFYYAKIKIYGEGGVVRNPNEGRIFFARYCEKVPEAKRIEGWKELEGKT